MLNCLGKYSQTPVWQPCDSCQILDLINFKTTSIWLDLPTLLKSVQILGRNTVKLLTGTLKSLHSLGSSADDFPLIQISSILSVIFTRLRLKCQRVFWWASCTSARHAGRFDCLVTSLILITMDNGRGYCAYWRSCKVPNQTHRLMKKKKENVCYKTNLDLYKILGHATQASVRFVRHTWASSCRPQPRFLTNQPWPG